jgi:hypothetical protein
MHLVIDEENTILVKYLAPFELIKKVINSRQWGMVLNSDLIQGLVIYANIDTCRSFLGTTKVEDPQGDVLGVIFPSDKTRVLFYLISALTLGEVQDVGKLGEEESRSNSIECCLFQRVGKPLGSSDTSVYDSMICCISKRGSLPLLSSLTWWTMHDNMNLLRVAYLTTSLLESTSRTVEEEVEVSL